MPCNTIQTSTVNLELKADNKAFLKAALQSLGYAVNEIGETVTFASRAGLRGVFANGKMQLNGPDYIVESFDANAVKRAYSAQVVNATAKKFGWKLNKVADSKFAVQKAGF